MAFPVVGDIIWLPYNWHKPMPGDEAKYRPCYVLAIDDQAKKMVVLPITHAKPRDDRVRWAVEIDAETADNAGLDDRQSYLICDEANRFAWPTKHQQDAPVGELKGQIVTDIVTLYDQAMSASARPLRAPAAAPKKPGGGGKRS